MNHLLHLADAYPEQTICKFITVPMKHLQNWFLFSCM